MRGCKWTPAPSLGPSVGREADAIAAFPRLRSHRSQGARLPPSLLLRVSAAPGQPQFGLLRRENFAQRVVGSGTEPHSKPRTCCLSLHPCLLSVFPEAAELPPVTREMMLDVRKSGVKEQTRAVGSQRACQGQSAQGGDSGRRTEEPVAPASQSLYSHLGNSSGRPSEASK